MHIWKGNEKSNTKRRNKNVSHSLSLQQKQTTPYTNSYLRFYLFCSFSTFLPVVFAFHSKKNFILKQQRKGTLKQHRPRCFFLCQASNMYLCSSFCSWLSIVSPCLDPTLNYYHKMKVPFISFSLFLFFIFLF